PCHSLLDAYAPQVPRLHQRSSPALAIAFHRQRRGLRGPLRVGSSNTSLAVSKLILCFARLRRFLVSSLEAHFAICREYLPFSVRKGPPGMVWIDPSTGEANLIERARIAGNSAPPWTAKARIGRGPTLNTSPKFWEWSR